MRSKLQNVTLKRDFVIFSSDELIKSLNDEI